ncbi:type II toxin-antitoxin system RelE/ParE family toxin [Porticoccus sp. GXU_MW_L64]
MERTLKPIYWEGTSKSDLLGFPNDAKQTAGYQLHRLQQGNDPLDWKPLKNLGKGISGVYEIRIWSDDGTYRVAYVTKLKDGITVLHCWQKTTQATAKPDIKTIIDRYKAAKQRLKI